ncbi:MAG: hypothetical protein JXJ20_01060 [Anaerolineae bacterium]|jgi:hypothetical protein|nr:hypothetical protein [Anaerolineae bacterium]
MQARFIRFGEVEIDGVRHTKDVVIDRGKVIKRDKTESRKHKARFGHTPLSAKENIPWNCQRLIIGTGAYGRLPIMKKVKKTAKQRGVELVTVPTPRACELISQADLATTNAILHLTC